MDPSLRSWVPVPAGCGLPIQNLPYAVFRRPGEAARVGVGIGEHMADLTVIAPVLEAVLPGAAATFSAPTLNAFLARGRNAWRTVRRRLSALLSEGAEPGDVDLAERALVPLRDVELGLPVEVGDFVDFYASVEHATNVGRIFRPEDQPLLPSWRHLPVGYHGRAGTVVVSGTPIVRPHGQSLPKDADRPVWGPSSRLDFELEVGFLTGAGPPLGTPIPVARARDHIFGLVLTNDWSARDIQAWESRPLGPFLGKSFATSISPWVVPLDAVLPYAVGGPEQNPPVLDHLTDPQPRGLDVRLQVRVESAAMRRNGQEPMVVTDTTLAGMYWSFAQMVAHATSNGATIRPGDLFASGTVSGPHEVNRGCLIERTWDGAQPLRLPDGSTRTYLEDGDRVEITGWCGAEDGEPISLGVVSGTIEPARAAD